MGNTERSRAEVILETQSTRVLPGQSLKGKVVANTEEKLGIKSAQLTLTCAEETHIRMRLPFISGDREENHPIPPGRFSGAYLKSVTTARTLTLHGEDTLSPPGAKFPFELETPGHAIPSYSGRSATVRWWLEAKVVLVSESELVAKSEVTVLPMAQKQARGVIVTSKPGASVGLELEVLEDVVEPGGDVRGRLTVSQLKAKPQRIHVRLMSHEFAKARQTVGYQIDTTDVLLAEKELFDRERLEEGVSQHFTLKVPEGAVTYVGKNSSSRLLVKATAALRFRRDVSLSIQVHVGTFV